MIESFKIDSELVEIALARSRNEFPEDVYGLLRVFMHVLVLMNERDGITMLSGSAQEIDALIVDRIKVIVEGDELRLQDL